MSLPSNSLIRLLYRTSTSLLSSFVSMILSAYQSTLDFQFEGEEHILRQEALGKNYLLVVWHSFVDAALFALYSRRLVVYSDHPRIPAYEKSIAHYFREVGLKTLRAYGYDVVDASLGKQSAGIIEYMKKIKEGIPALISPDGPNGPIYEAKPGTIYIGAKTDSAIIPVGFGFSRKITGPNWDDFCIPLPFSRVVVVFGEPIRPPEKPDEETQKEYSIILEHTLDKLCFRASELARTEFNADAL